MTQPRGVFYWNEQLPAEPAPGHAPLTYQSSRARRGNCDRLLQTGTVARAHRCAHRGAAAKLPPANRVPVVEVPPNRFNKLWRDVETDRHQRHAGIHGQHGRACACPPNFFSIRSCALLEGLHRMPQHELFPGSCECLLPAARSPPGSDLPESSTLPITGKWNVSSWIKK